MQPQFSALRCRRCHEIRTDSDRDSCRPTGAMLPGRCRWSPLPMIAAARRAAPGKLSSAEDVRRCAAWNRWSFRRPECACGPGAPTMRRPCCWRSVIRRLPGGIRSTDPTRTFGSRRRGWRTAVTGPGRSMRRSRLSLWTTTSSSARCRCSRSTVSMTTRRSALDGAAVAGKGSRHHRG